MLFHGSDLFFLLTFDCVLDIEKGAKMERLEE